MKVNFEQLEQRRLYSVSVDETLVAICQKPVQADEVVNTSTDDTTATDGTDVAVDPSVDVVPVVDPSLVDVGVPIVTTDPIDINPDDGVIYTMTGDDSSSTDTSTTDDSATSDTTDGSTDDGTSDGSTSDLAPTDNTSTDPVTVHTTFHIEPWYRVLSDQVDNTSAGDDSSSSTDNSSTDYSSTDITDDNTTSSDTNTDTPVDGGSTDGNLEDPNVIFYCFGGMSNGTATDTTDTATTDTTTGDTTGSDANASTDTSNPAGVPVDAGSIDPANAPVDSVAVNTGIVPPGIMHTVDLITLNGQVDEKTPDTAIDPAVPSDKADTTSTTEPGATDITDQIPVDDSNISTDVVPDGIFHINNFSGGSMNDSATTATTEADPVLAYTDYAPVVVKGIDKAVVPSVSVTAATTPETAPAPEAKSLFSTTPIIRSVLDQKDILNLHSDEAVLA